MPSPIVTALASFGMSGQVFHAPFLEGHEGFKLKYIVERSKELSQEKYPNAIIARSFKEVLSDPEVELVIVNTPNQLHEPMTREALLADKHVVVEKPFAIMTSEGEALVALAASKNLCLNVYHNKRFEGEFKTVSKLIRNNTLGKLSVFETHFDRYRPEIGTKKWKEEDIPGAGLLYDLGPHMIDQVLLLFGLPLSLTADLQIQREESKVIDYFHITFHYATHDAIVTAGMFAQGPVIKYLIKGDKGVFTKYGADPQEALLKQGVSPLIVGWGKEPSGQWGKIITKDGGESFVQTISGSYMDYYTKVYKNIREGSEPAVPLQDALNTMRIIELALESGLHRVEKVR